MGFSDWLSSWFGIGIVRTYPRHSTRQAKKMFGNRPIVVAEIGVWKAENSLSILKTLNVSEFYLIDPYLEYKDYSKESLNNGIAECRKKAERRMNSPFGNIFWIRKKSHEAVKELNRELDFVYIDGNHDYKYVMQDMEDYWKKVKKGGLMAGHDITNCPGVVKAVINFSKKYNLLPVIKRDDWWFVKVKR